MNQRWLWGILAGFWLAMGLHGLPVTAQVSPQLGVMEQGVSAYHAGDLITAIAQWQQALTLALPPETRALVQQNLALAYREQGRFDQAIQAWHEAIALYRRHQPKSPEIAQWQIDQAQAYSTLGQDQRAIDQLVALVAQSLDPPLLTLAQGALGNAYGRIGKYEEAIAQFTTALNTPQLPSELAATLLNDLGNTYGRYYQDRQRQATGAEIEGDLDLARQLFQQAATLKAQGLAALDQAMAQSADPLRQAQAQLNRHKLAPNPGQWPTIAEQIAAQLRTLPPRQPVAIAWLNLSQQLDNDQPLAQTAAVAALGIANHIGDQRSQSFAWGRLGECYHAQGDDRQGLQALEQAQFLAQQSNAPDSLYRWQWQAGRMFNEQGDRPRAIQAYQQAIATLQTIRGDLVSANRDFQFDFQEAVEPVYRELMALLFTGDNVAFVGPKQESKLANATAENSVQAALDVLELLKLAELQNFFGDDCVQVAKSQGNAQEAIAASNTALLYSVILPDQTQMILKAPDGRIIHHRVDIAQGELEDLIEEFRYRLELRITNQYRPLAQKLYDLLIRPLAADLAAINPDTILMINDGALRRIPLGALQDGRTFLIEEYAIATTPSLSLTTGGTPQDQTEIKALSVGLTVGRDAFAPLSNVAQEITTVQSLMGGPKLLDQDFTIANLKQNLLNEDFAVIHMATHGKFGIDAENTFLLGYDQTLSLAELDSMLRSRASNKSNAQPVALLTMSACQTAAGDNRSALGIAGAAVRAGVQATLATLWYINDEATVPLIEEFYRQWRGGEITKAEALRRAQLRMINDPSFNHPAVWSPFVLVGNWL
ncbi:CHAT domain-containing protein [Spirulina sp. CCNP1310]|uniref:CHAT domain-containing protein n=1 Tax=Spirulina sp. CCNP1310 TaxID=3110249 RepID=UPI002B20F258|nr:CHAT domain-containing protein [Spirulina sp. CCNP1310]MEA5418177.1 CHAT domain-containing protein [Spirulina sp. CCNP1310]